VVDALIQPTDKQVNQYYQENKENYFLTPQVTFTHVFFSIEQRNKEQAAKSAEKEYKYLNEHALPFEVATSRGDRFHYHTNYVERDPEYVASHFSKTFAEKIFEASPSYQWIGPFESAYGYHLVMVTSSEPGRYPELSEIRDKVKEDAKYWQKQQRNNETIQALVDTYEVKVAYQPNS
jgi:parvulin-like peptidyl-prolyl isomerase